MIAACFHGGPWKKVFAFSKIFRIFRLFDRRLRTDSISLHIRTVAQTHFEREHCIIHNAFEEALLENDSA
jgi:hypothetical protein